MLLLPISVNNQAYIFLCSVLGGLVIAFVYDVFRVKRKAVRTRGLFIHIEDLVYWIIIAVVMFGVVYYSNEGEIRGFIFIGTIIGVILYVFLLSKIIMAAALFILKVICRILSILWKIISFPFIVLVKILAVPARFFLRLAAKGLKKVKRAGKNRLALAVVWRRIFRNIRKKI